jgi:hypothetical protein
VYKVENNDAVLKRSNFRRGDDLLLEKNLENMGA